MPKLVVTFGEIMLRLAPPDFDRFLQRPEFMATWGGGGANVAVGLGNLGMPARYVSVLPPNNPIVDAFLGGGSVSLTAKARGFRVICNDGALRSALVGRALIENDRVTLAREDITRLFAVDPGESPAQCAQRELAEEIGYEAGRLETLFSMYLAPGYCSELIHLFVATELTPARRAADDDEFIKPTVVTSTEAWALIEDGSIQDAKTIAAILAYLGQQMGPDASPPAREGK